MSLLQLLVGGPKLPGPVADAELLSMSIHLCYCQRSVASLSQLLAPLSRDPFCIFTLTFFALLSHVFDSVEQWPLTHLVS